MPHQAAPVMDEQRQDLSQARLTAGHKSSQQMLQQLQRLPSFFKPLNVLDRDASGLLRTNLEFRRAFHKLRTLTLDSITIPVPTTKIISTSIPLAIVIKHPTSIANGLDYGIKLRANAQDLNQLTPLFTWETFFANASDKAMVFVGCWAASFEATDGPRRIYIFPYFSLYLMSTGYVQIRSGDPFAPLEIESGLFDKLISWSHRGIF
ncbi:hypothetical protein K438DRAFT_1980087 [Mycena galopus ATCC 62051]|nr:hypothetical protein K438DRAFT_1980087 [Mycena galopus ATCC 62051]